MSLFKKIMIIILPLIMLSNLVIASDDSASQTSEESEDSGEPVKKKKSKKREKFEKTLGTSKGSKKLSRFNAAKSSETPQAPNKQDIEDLTLLLSKEANKYYKVADYSAGTENTSTYTSLADILAAFFMQTEMGTGESEAGAQAKLSKIVAQSKKFRGGKDNIDIKTLADMVRNTDGYKREQQLKKACVKKEDLDTVKEAFGVTDADINLETGEMKDADGKTHKLRSLIESCYPKSE